MGLGRLVLSTDSSTFRIWNTPKPPPLTDCLFACPKPPIFETRFSAIDMRACLGITFFVRGGTTYAIHTHTLQSPCALSTLQQLHHYQQMNLAWIYVPVSDTDRIEAFGTRWQVRRGRLITDSPSFVVSHYHNFYAVASNMLSFARLYLGI